MFFVYANFSAYLCVIEIIIFTVGLFVGEEGWDEVAKDKIIAKADELQDKDFDRYWLFVYEVYRFEGGKVLVDDKDAENKLLEKFDCLRKKHGISFIRKDFREKCNHKIRKR